VVRSARTLGLTQQPFLIRQSVNTASVRQAVLADLAELAVLFDQYRRFQGQPSDLAAARLFLSERFNHGEAVLFVAEEGPRPLGFAQLYPSFSSVSLQRVFILNDLFVAEAGRRKGIASLLLSAVESYARSLGAVRISLNVAQSNLSAQALYAARGWTKDAEFFMFHRYPT
jgi:GNAT superfamily N-acetyltransferase